MSVVHSKMQPTTQFGTRFFLAMLFLLLALIALLGLRHRYRAHQVETRVNEVINYWGARNAHVIPNRESRWFEVFGLHFVDRRHISVDVALADLVHVPHLQRLILQRTNVSDSGLKHLRHVPELIELDLRQTGVTDSGMSSLGGLTKLYWLNLQETLVSDKGLADLAMLDSLEFLSLSETKVTDQGLPELEHLKNLKELHLPTGLSDSGLVHVSRLLRLEQLSVGGSPTRPTLTDKGIDSLSRLRNLEELTILFGSISDECVPIFERFPKLKLLMLNRCTVSAETVKKLRAQLKGIEIDVYPDPE